MRISDWSSDVCSSDLSRTTANFPLWATIAPRYASRRVSASRAHSMTGADPTPFQRKGEGRAVGDPIGRASSRARVCQYVSRQAVAVSFEKKRKMYSYVEIHSTVRLS